MRDFCWQPIFDERVLGEGQAVSWLESDSSGAEPTIAMIFVAVNLSSKHAAPKGCL